MGLLYLGIDYSGVLVDLGYILDAIEEISTYDHRSVKTRHHVRNPPISPSFVVPRSQMMSSWRAALGRRGSVGPIQNHVFSKCINTTISNPQSQFWDLGMCMGVIEQNYSWL